MKPEPLKNRLCKYPDLITPKSGVFFKEDIKSAVEWLKEELKSDVYKKVRDEAYRRKFKPKVGGLSGYMHTLIVKKIDEAFEDIIKEASERK